ncbi:hypothetical protein BO94DRAFT_592765 [Aspergillus sclerotioniger CBS 115572]|uniref:Allergen Asp f 4 n=1 Tax=Aspergillus sclerotioniger CBS 115572 TaxID=1450535 RepID=A0A317XEU9_9EURO|nr:hypothetical protein BO94DRAFT_592765 [Aspergillus sclerotioniger CBS 115572]PWY96751.1 hypothetical protein BO94DRAFT_592765 [Aspergillus sclerotioniger CBS 115572]
MHFTTPLLLAAALITPTFSSPTPTKPQHGHTHGHSRRQISIGASASISISIPSASSTSTSSGSSSDWTSTPSSGSESTSGFGTQTNSTGSGDTYIGNVGSPWGSNMLEVSSSSASSYKYVMELTLPSTSSSSDSWTVVFWNKYGPDGKMDGFYGYSALSFTMSPGDTKYVAFDEDTQGAFGAAEGSSLPTGSSGIYDCTWGEFDFGSTVNDDWSGFDVSAIQAQKNSATVQGLQMCDVLGGTCSSITADAGSVDNAYTEAEEDEGGIGGNISAGAVRIKSVLDYSG